MRYSQDLSNRKCACSMTAKPPKLRPNLLPKVQKFLNFWVGVGTLRNQSGRSEALPLNTNDRLNLGACIPNRGRR